MLDRFRKDDGSFGPPDYKLNATDLDCLYDDHAELDCFRAAASVTAMKGWIDHSYPEHIWDSASYQSRKMFYEQLKCTGAECRTHDMLTMFNLVDSYIIDTEVDDLSFCTNVSRQYIGKMVAMQINSNACVDGWNECGTTNGSGGSYGAQAYSDITGYYPVHGPNEKKSKHRWKPIL